MRAGVEYPQIVNCASAGGWATAYIGVGANLGDRQRTIRQALEQLGEDPSTMEVVAASSLIESTPVGGPPGAPLFLNGAAEVRTTLGPAELLNRLLEIERRLGRVRDVKWAPRVIDLDLLFYADQMVRAPGLRIPHPLLHERRFVLQPLAQIAPNLVHPVLGRTVQQLLDELGPGPADGRRPPAAG